MWEFIKFINLILFANFLDANFIAVGFTRSNAFFDISFLYKQRPNPQSISLMATNTIQKSACNIPRVLSQTLVVLFLRSSYSC